MPVLSPVSHSTCCLDPFHCLNAGADLGGGCRGCAPPPPEMTCGFLIQLVFCKKKQTIWFIGLEVEQETSPPPPKKILDPPLECLLAMWAEYQCCALPLSSFSFCKSETFKPNHMGTHAKLFEWQTFTAIKSCLFRRMKIPCTSLFKIKRKQKDKAGL